MHPTPDWLKNIPRLPEFNDNLKLFGGHQQSVPNNWEIDWESHFAFEILTLKSGRQKTCFRMHEITVNENDIMLIPPGLEHKNICISDSGMEYFCMHFFIDNMQIQNNLIINCPIILEPENPHFNLIKNTLESFINILNLNVITLRDELVIEKLLWDLLIYLVDYSEYEEQKLVNLENSSLVLAKSIADKIKYDFHEYTNNISFSYDSLFTIEELAHHFSISESTLLKTFKKVYRISPKQFLDQLRNNEARYLLSQPNILISEIAELVGYSSVSHFSRQFKKWNGMSPKEYKEYLNEKLN